MPQPRACAGDILFLGKMTDPEDVLASCDCSVDLRDESFGLAALEAMACRCLW